MSIRKIQRYYDHNFYGEEDVKYITDRWLELASNGYLVILRAKPPGYLLDIACGCGHLLKVSESRGFQCYGLDISRKAVRIASRATRDAQFVVASGESLPYRSNTFDYVTIIGSLEHFINVGKGIAEIIRVSKDTTKICIVVPNSNFYLDKMRVGHMNLILPGKRWRGTKQPREIKLSLDQWKSVIERNGLKVVAISKDFPPYYAIEPLIVPRMISKLLKYGLFTFWKLLPVYITLQFIFVCKKG